MCMYYDMIRKLEACKNITPAITDGYFIDKTGNREVMIVEYLPYTLSDLIESNFTTKNVCELVVGLFRTLACIHNLSYVHTDLKPENIMFRTRDFSKPIIIDFGSLVSTGSIGFSKTKIWASMGQHDGKKLTYIDDLETVGYILYHIISRMEKSAIPWEKSGVQKIILDYKKNKLSSLLKKDAPKLIDYFRVLNTYRDRPYDKSIYDRLYDTICPP